MKRYDPNQAPKPKVWRESRTLAALRDALLPKLVSGELRIAAAEKILENAV